MTVIVKSKSALTVPPEVQRQAGIKTGDRLEFRVSGRIITILPEVPTADDEYTPQQRKILDARLAEGLADIKAGRVYGPFETHEEMMDSLRGHAKKAKSKTSKRVSR